MSEDRAESRIRPDYVESTLYAIGRISGWCLLVRDFYEVGEKQPYKTTFAIVHRSDPKRQLIP